MLTTWESTSSIEQSFAIARHLTSSLKSNTSPATARNLLKVVLDGPQPEDVALHKICASSAEYQTSVWARRVQTAWRRRFGSATNHMDLPRRTLRPRAKRGLPKFLEEQSAEKAALRGAGGPTPDVLGQWRASTDQEAQKQREKRGYKWLAESLQEQACKKRRLLEAFAAGTDPDAEQKLKTQRKEQEARELAVGERRDLNSMAEKGVFLQSEVCAVVPCKPLSATQTGVLLMLGLKIVEFGTGKTCLEQLLRSRHIIWLAPTHDLETSLIDGVVSAVDPALLAATRLLGGFIGGPEWVDVCQSLGKVLQPVLCLCKGAHTKREVCLHKSLGCREQLTALLLQVANLDQLRLILRSKAKQVPEPQAPACLTPCHATAARQERQKSDDRAQPAGQEEEHAGLASLPKASAIEKNQSRKADFKSD